MDKLFPHGKLNRSTQMQFKQLFIITSLCLLTMSCASHMPANESYDVNGEHQEQAFSGSAADIYKMGNRYAHGLGVPQDDKKAVEYYAESARRGYAKAQYALGYMYRTGRGVPRNYNAAAEWFEQAADQGNATA